MCNIKFVTGSVLLTAMAFYWFRYQDHHHHLDSKSIANQRVLVTGASSGIGEQLAYEYSKLGARLVITARRELLLQDVAQKCRDFGAKQVEVFVVDMSKAEDRNRLIMFTQKTFGGGLDQLILNHAMVRYKLWAKNADQNLDILHHDMDVNFVSYVDLASKALPLLEEVKGRIGVVSSVVGKIGFLGFSHYSSTKFALQGFFTSFRQELLFQKSNVSVTVCILGLIDTDTSRKLLTEHYPTQAATTKATSVVDTAQAIIQGVNDRVYEVYYPRSYAWTVTFQHFFPVYHDRLYINRLVD